MDAQNDGTVINFFRNNLKTTKDDSNKYFIEKVTTSTNKIIALAETSIKKKEANR